MQTFIFMFIVGLLYYQSWILLILVFLAGWFYKTRALYYFPIIFSFCLMPFIFAEAFKVVEYPKYFSDILDWAGAFYFSVVILMPVAGLIFSKIKEKKADKRFLYGLLLNLILLVIMAVLTPYHFLPIF